MAEPGQNPRFSTTPHLPEALPVLLQRLWSASMGDKGGEKDIDKREVLWKETVNALDAEGGQDTPVDSPNVALLHWPPRPTQKEKLDMEAIRSSNIQGEFILSSNLYISERSLHNVFFGPLKNRTASPLAKMM